MVKNREKNFFNFGYPVCIRKTEEYKLNLLFHKHVNFKLIGIILQLFKKD